MRLTSQSYKIKSYLINGITITFGIFLYPPTYTEECLYLVIGCKIAIEVWECLEENLLQATKDKEFQLKQQVQNIKLGDRFIDDYLKEFKGLCDGLAAIRKPFDEDNKVICFAR